uniref:Uncharacterized protein n=1 Tax=Plectus sambesii TaxID=2011161 RepID=A0A914VW88_9BILA
MDYSFEYKVCCGNCHVLTATKLMSAVESLLLAASLIDFATSGNTTGLIFLLVKAIVLACLFYALKADKANYILPHLAGTAIDMVFIFVLLIKFLVEHPGVSSSHESQTAGVVFCVFIVFVLAEAWEIWSMFVAYRCYQYLKLTEDTEGRHSRSAREPLSRPDRTY